MDNVTQEQIDMLRKAAAALVEDCAEPCWGLAQGLSQLAEQLMQPIESHMISMGFGESSCCLACGEYKGIGHRVWCIYAYDEQYEQWLEKQMSDLEWQLSQGPEIYETEELQNPEPPL